MHTLTLRAVVGFITPLRNRLDRPVLHNDFADSGKACLRMCGEFGLGGFAGLFTLIGKIE